MPPRISIIIPAYNRAATILRAVNSVLTQTFQDFEIIVVDDGSTDHISELVRSMGDTRVSLLSHKRNLGTAAARNTGMEASRSQYVAWLDSDDEWVPEKLDIQLQALQSADFDKKACYTAHERIEKGISRIHVPAPTNYKNLFLGCDQAPGSSLLFERSVLNEIGYLDTSLRRYEDWDWLLRYCSKYSLVAINQPLVRVYFSPDRPSGQMESSAWAFISKYSETLKQFGLYRNRVISRCWIEVASYYAREHNSAKVVYFLMKGFFIYPFHHPSVWAWVVNSWFGIKVGSSLSKTDKAALENN